jgi:hypothetical protein
VCFGEKLCLHFVSSNAKSLFGNTVLGRKDYGCHGEKISLNSTKYLFFYGFFSEVLAICILCALFIVFLNFHCRILLEINTCMCMKH